MVSPNSGTKVSTRKVQTLGEKGPRERKCVCPFSSEGSLVIHNS